MPTLMPPSDQCGVPVFHVEGLVEEQANSNKDPKDG